MKMKSSLLLIAALAMAGPTFAAPMVYVPMGMANQIIIIDAAKDQIVGKMTDVANSHALAGSADGKMLIAGSIAAKATAKGTLPPKPQGMSEAVHKSHHMGMAGKAKQTGQVSSNLSVIMTATNSVFRRIVIPGAIHHAMITPNGRYGIATLPAAGGVSVIDLQKFAVLKTVPTGPVPNYAVASPDGAFVYVSNAGNGTISEINTASWQVARNIKVGKAPEHIVLSPKGDRLYTANVGSGTVSVIDIKAGSVIKTYTIGGSLHGIDLSADGKTLFIAGRGYNKLVAIDLVSDKQNVLALVPQPYHLAVINSVGKLYVSSAKEHKIWVIDQQSLKILGQIAVPGTAHQMAIMTAG